LRGVKFATFAGWQQRYSCAADADADAGADADALLSVIVMLMLLLATRHMSRLAFPHLL
jgi:hypothetical protein